MPRYFFDVIDADGIQRDDAGQTFPDQQAANVVASTALLDIARDLVGRNSTSLRIEIRNDADATVVRKRLELTQDVIEGP